MKYIFSHPCCLQTQMKTSVEPILSIDVDVHIYFNTKARNWLDMDDNALSKSFFQLNSRIF